MQISTKPLRKYGPPPQLTRSQVDEARELRRTQHMTYAALAKRYNISERCMYHYLNTPDKATRD